MDIKLLADSTDNGISCAALAAIAAKSRRRAYFSRSVIRCAAVALLFIAAGCFYTVYVKETGRSLPPLRFGYTDINVKQMLKDMFFLSVIPVFSLFFSFNRLSGILCDRLFPALYGAYAGVYLFRVSNALYSSFSAVDLVAYAPGVIFVLAVLCIYTLFCPVCASYSACLYRSGTAKSDLDSLLSYFFITLSLICCALLLRSLAAHLIILLD